MGMGETLKLYGIVSLTVAGRCLSIIHVHAQVTVAKVAVEGYGGVVEGRRGLPSIEGSQRKEGNRTKERSSWAGWLLSRLSIRTTR